LDRRLGGPALKLDEPLSNSEEEIAEVKTVIQCISDTKKKEIHKLFFSHSQKKMKCHKFLVVLYSGI
jgi:hypothetical protein